MALNETFFNHSSQPYISDYGCIWDDRVDGYGRVTIFIHRSIAYNVVLSRLGVPHTLQAMAKELKTFLIMRL